MSNTFNQIEIISDKELPNLFQASDDASKKAQLNYLLILGCDLAFMTIASGLAIYNYKNINSKEWIYILSGLFLLFGLIFTIIIKAKKFEAIWYQGRALAESCKTLAWRFTTCAELFEVTLSDAMVQNLFVDKLRELNKEFTELNKVLDSNILNKPIITDLMWKIRNLGMPDRKNYYLRYRITDQKDWYSRKAEFNKKRYNFWFVVIILSQTFALISISYLIKYPDSNWNLVGLFTTVASSAISWLQLKQHQELKQAYTTAAQELNFISALANQVQTEEELSKFVLDSENAISREHTLWLAQKRK